jgi:multiple sugar transport system permease protein
MEKQLLEIKSNGPKPKKYMSKKMRESIYGYLFILPILIGILGFIVFPFFISIFSTFVNWNGYYLKGLFELPSKGFDMYLRILRDKQFWIAFRNTLITLIGVPVGLILSILLALLLNRGIKGTNAFRVIFYVPVVCSITAIVVLWHGLLAGEGPLNQIVMALGFKKIGWTSDLFWSPVSLIMMCVWRGLGTSTLLYIAGLQSIPKSYYEAARLDGGNNWQIFWHVTFPLLGPTHFFMLVTGVIGGMQIYTEPRYLGARSETTKSVVMYLMEKFEVHRASEASVAAWILAIFIFALTAIQFYVNHKRSKAK